MRTRAGEQKRLQKERCEQLPLLPALLAVTFKCQDSSSPIRNHESSHVEKVGTLTATSFTMAQNLFVCASARVYKASRSTARGELQDSSVIMFWWQGTKHVSMHRTTNRNLQGLENTETERSASYLQLKNTKTPNPIPTHLPAQVQWQQIAKVNVSGKNSIAQNRTVLNYTDPWLSTSHWPTNAFKTTNTDCGCWTRTKFLWPLDVPVPPLKRSCEHSLPSLHIMEL